MYWQGAAVLLLCSSTYITQAAAQVITITRFPSTCSAIYTSGSRSVTVAQSTVTVSPVPWNDDIANNGEAPFVLQALPIFGGLATELESPGSRKRQAGPAPQWVTPNGYITTDGSRAAQYLIRHGMLTTVAGGWISTFEGIPYATFAVSSTVGSLNRTFSVSDGQIMWSNSAFTHDMARFCQTIPTAQDAAHLIAHFYGPALRDCRPFRLYARPVIAATQGTSPPAGMSSTATISSIDDDTSSMQPLGQPGISNSPYNTPTYSYAPTTGGQGGQQTGSSGGSGQASPDSGQEAPSSTPLGGSAQSSARTSQGDHNPATSGGGSQGQASPTQYPTAVSSSSAPISPDGICGGDTDLVCMGSDCCGQYGYCGTGADYCGPGCQPAAGYCWAASTSWTTSTSLATSTSRANSGTSMAMSSDIRPTSYPPAVSIPSSSGVVSMSMTASMSMTQPASTSTSRASSTRTNSPAPTDARCPADDMKNVTDATGMQYTLGCGQDTTVNSYSSEPAAAGFNDCFSFCDASPLCVAFTYQGGVNGVGPGTCYLKGESDQTGMPVFVEFDERSVGAIRVRAVSGASTTSASTAYSTYTPGATPIGPDNPGGPESRTSSSVVYTTFLDSTSGLTSMPMIMSMSMSMSMSIIGSASAAPLPTQPVSPDGHCGTQNNGGTPEGWTCTGSVFGACCSLSGYCGDSSEYCLAGCQSDFGECTPQEGNTITANGGCGVRTDETCTGGYFGPCCSTSGYCGFSDDYCAPENCDPLFGTCDETSPTSMMMASTSIVDSMSTDSPTVATSSSLMDQLTASSDLSSATPTTSSLCPDANGTIYTDPIGNDYTILCGVDFDPESFFIQPALNLAACIDACLYQTDQVCVGVTFGLGTCYLKAYFDASWSNSGLDSAVLVSTMQLRSSSSSSSSSMSVSSTSWVMMASSSPAGLTDSSSSTMRMSSLYSSTASRTMSSSLSSSKAVRSSSSSSSSRPAITTTTTTTTSTSSSSSSSPAVTTTTTSTTRTTTITTSTSSSASSHLVLPSPTSCDFGDPAGYDEDDSYCLIPLPFQMRIYGQSDSNTFASTNGYLSITYGSSQYSSRQYPANSIPNNTVAPFFDDLYLHGDASPTEGIFYQIQGTAVTYEWYVGRLGIAANLYHFTMRYDSATPGIFTYTYYSTGGADDQGEYASVGMQGRNEADVAVGFTYAYHVQSIAPGLVVVCDTNANTCVTQT